MNRTQLQVLMMGLAARAREAIRTTGSYPQQLAIATPEGEEALAVMITENPGEPLHGASMGAFVRLVTNALKEAFGGIEAVVVSSDARMKRFTVEEFNARVPSTDDIADDEANPECIVLIGRAQGSFEMITMYYRREGSRITFEDEEPQFVDSEYRAETPMLPDLWETVH